jgi:hypothetical protein
VESSCDCGNEPSGSIEYIELVASRVALGSIELVMDNDQFVIPKFFDGPL